MSLIIATHEGIWADRRTVNERNDSVYCYNQNKIHELTKGIYYSATGSVITEDRYPALIREINEFLAGKEDRVWAVSGQSSDFTAFIANGEVYAQFANKPAQKVKQGDFFTGGSVGTEAEFLLMLGMSVPEVIKSLAKVDRSISENFDSVTLVEAS